MSTTEYSTKQTGAQCWRALSDGEQCHFQPTGSMPPLVVEGPGLLTISLQVVDRRIATQQRRARGFGYGPQTRRARPNGKTAYGRRSTDKADHEDRRQRVSQRRARGYKMPNPGRRRGAGRRAGDEAAHVDRRIRSWSVIGGAGPAFGHLPGIGRRATDPKDRRGAPCILFGGRRVLDPKERRSNLTKVYRISSDPRVRLLERRNGRPYSFVTCPAPPMAAVAEGQRRADPSQYFIPPENRK